MKLAFLTSHPIQYQVPVFRHLSAAAGVDFTTLFCTLPTAEQQGAEFGVKFEWDIPLLDGYRYHVLDNVSKEPSLVRFRGCDTPGVYEYLKEQAFDAVVVNGWVVKSCLQTARACRRLGIPCIVRGEANHLRKRAWWKRLIHRRLMKLFDAYCPIGKSSTTFYRELGVREDALFLAPYCIENERIAAISTRTPDEVAEARQRFGLESDSTVFLFCGKLIDKKHPLGLLEATRIAVQLGGRFQVLIVGEGHLRESCSQFVDDHQLPVRFSGFLNQSQIGQAYRASNALVLPSDNGETWGLVVNEAFAAQIPALVSDQVGCHLDLIHADQTGWVHPFGDWTRLAEQMVEAASDQNRLMSMGSNANRLIQKYRPQDAADGILLAANFAIQAAG